MLRVVENDGGMPVGADAEMLAEVDSIRAKLLSGELREFCWVGVTSDEEVITSVTSTANAMVRMAGVARLLHQLNLAADRHGDVLTT